MIIRLKTIIKLMLILTFSFLIALNPTECIESATKGIFVCGKIILPSLFPFMVISKYLIYSGLGEKVAKRFSLLPKIFNLPKISSVAFILGSICGFPTGASVVCDFYKEKLLSKEEAENMLGFCSNAGPLFLIGTIGICLFNNKKTGYFLYFVHIISAIITGFIVRPKNKITENGNTKRVINISPFTNAVTDSAFGVISVCGFIVIFSVISGYVNLLIKNRLIRAIVSSFLEISNGFVHLCALDTCKALKLCLVSMFCGFSGICIIFQTLSVAKKAGLEIKPYIKTKMLFSIIAFSVCLMLIYVLNIFGVTKSFFE